MDKRALPLLIILLCVSCTAGCFLLDERQPVPTPVATTVITSVPTTDSGMSATSTADMALQLTDLPAGYIIRERGDIAYSEITPFAREQGWKSGYSVSFYRMNAEKYDITALSQRIGVYEIMNAHLSDRTMGAAFDTAEEELISAANESVTVTELPFPKTGDESAAYRIVDANDPYGITKYVVLFTKENVIESVEMRGTTTDYEQLKTLVGKAAGKI